VIYFENVSILNNPPTVKEKLPSCSWRQGGTMLAEKGKALTKTVKLSPSSRMSTERQQIRPISANLERRYGSSQNRTPSWRVEFFLVAGD
jgi:hypothetical protein